MSNLQQFDQLKADITIKLSPYLSLKVTDDDSMKQVMAAGKEAKEFHKKVDEQRKALVKPLNDKVGEINDYAKSLFQPIDQVITHSKSQLAQWENILEKKRQEEAKRLEEERKAKQAEIEKKAREEKEQAEMEASFGLKSDDEIKRDELVAKAAREREELELSKEAKSQQKEIAAKKVSGARKIWKHEVVNFNLVPRDFLVLDDKKVREAILAGNTNIPGLNIFQETSIGFR